MLNSQKLCSIETCNAPHRALGYCASHHRKFKKYGHAEVCSCYGCKNEVYNKEDQLCKECDDGA